MRSIIVGGFVLVILGLSAVQGAVPEATLVNQLPARTIGPANMGGRIVDLDVVESNPEILYVAAATGGLWKTTNGGTTWRPIFDHQDTLCLGDVTIAPSNPDIVWVGTGEANPRNSVSWGCGVYRSTDAGRSWQHMGLRETRHIGRLAIHPKKPEIVFVAALGHLWGPNKERGLYRSTDGGKSWQSVLPLDEDTGCIDVAIDPEKPEIVHAAAWQVRRDAFSGGNPAVQWGPKSGLYRSEDGGTSWKKLSAGLPSRPLGRCGIAVARKDPRIVYAVIQTDQTPSLVRNSTGREKGALDLGGVFRSEDRGQTWTKVNDLCPRPFYYGQIRIDPNDPKRIYVLGISLHVSSDGGSTFTTLGGRGVHSDHHALWINPRDSEHLVLGNDGGLYVSKTRGTRWEALRGMPLGQFYGIAVDLRRPYHIYGGLQDNGSWGGPSATPRAEGITLNDWRRVGGGDGFRCAADPRDPETIYVESQYGGLQRVTLKARVQNRAIKPFARAGQRYRFNWNSPIVLSPHDAQTLYYGGNVVFKSTDRGDHWEIISPDLTRGEPGPNSYNGHTLTALAESPLKPGVLYAGTDDGNLHVSRDGGKEWKNITNKIPHLAKERWITHLECSHFAEGTAYVTIDRHRQGDHKPYVYKTTDHGATWTSVAGNLPSDAPVNVLRESSRNRALLLVGTETQGLFISLDGGQRWHHYHAGLPARVPIDDLVIHPRERDLVVGTHGRSLYVVDFAPLEELTEAVRARAVHLFAPRPARAFAVHEPQDLLPAANYLGSNPPYGATIWYYLKEAAQTPVRIEIADATGKRIATRKGSTEAGLQRVQWDLKADGQKSVVASGDYGVTLQVGERTVTAKVQVEKTE